MKKKLSPKENLTLLQAYCSTNGIKVPWNKVFASGIYTEFKSVLPEDFLSGRKLYLAIGHHVRSVSYLKRLKVGAQRFGLNYRSAGVVTKAEAKLARECFFTMHAKQKAAKPAKTSATSKVTRQRKQPTSKTLTLAGLRQDAGVVNAKV